MRVIPLTQGLVTVIDAKNFRKVNRFKWSATRSAGKGRRWGEPYACRQETVNGKKKKVYLHRWLSGDPPGKIVDHRNNQTLDNRDENRQTVTHKENAENRADRKQFYRRK